MVALRRGLPVSWAAASVTALLGIVPVVVLGLAVPTQVVVPLGMLMGGVVAAAVACLVANRYDRGGPHSRIPTVTGIVVIIALALAAAWLLLPDLPSPVIGYVVVCAVVIGGAAATAARRLRTSDPAGISDVAMAFLLVATCALVVAAFIPMFCLTTGSCGA